MISDIGESQIVNESFSCPIFVVQKLESKPVTFDDTVLSKEILYYLLK